MIGKGANEPLAQTAGGYRGFRSIKHVVVFLLSTGCRPLTGLPSVIFCRYPVVHPSGERLWSKVTPQWQVSLRPSEPWHYLWYRWYKYAAIYCLINWDLWFIDSLKFLPLALLVLFVQKLTFFFNVDRKLRWSMMKLPWTCFTARYILPYFSLSLRMACKNQNQIKKRDRLESPVGALGFFRASTSYQRTHIFMLSWTEEEEVES